MLKASLLRTPKRTVLAEDSYFDGSEDIGCGRDPADHTSEACVDRKVRSIFHPNMCPQPIRNWPHPVVLLPVEGEAEVSHAIVALKGVLERRYDDGLRELQDAGGSLPGRGQESHCGSGYEGLEEGTAAGGFHADFYTRRLCPASVRGNVTRKWEMSFRSILGLNERSMMSILSGR